MLRSLMSVSHVCPGGHSAGSFLLMPLSAEIVVVTKKKINNKNAISAIEPALTCGEVLCLIMISFRYLDYHKYDTRNKHKKNW